MTRPRSHHRLGVTAALLCVGLAAQPTLAARWLVPASAHADGANGAKFRTDLTLVNPGGSAAEVAIRFLPADTDNSSLPDPVSRNVPAAGQLVLGDVVDTLFGKGGGGSLLVESSTDGLVVASRTYNQLSDRTFGTFLPGLRVDEALPAGETGHLVFLAKSDVYRSNVGFAGPTATAGTATVNLYGGSGELLGTVSRDVRGFGQTQINDVFSAAGAAATTVARAEVVATVPLFVYATVIDNRTGDPFPLLALRARDAAKELVLTSAAHAAGANNSNFRSDLRVLNTEDNAGTLTLALYPSGASTPSPDTRTVPLAPRQLLALDDLLLTTFGQSSLAGAVKLTSDRLLFSISRTYNVAADGSTSGQELPAIPLAGYVTSGDVALLAGISSQRARTNLIFFNATDQPIPVTIDMKGVSTAIRRTPLASTTTTLAPFSATQLNGITGILGVPVESTGYIELRSQGTGRYWAIATVIDSGSNDPLHVGPAIRRDASQEDCTEISAPPLNVAFAYRLSAVIENITSFVNTYEEFSSTASRVHAVQLGTQPTFNADFVDVSSHHVADDLFQIERVERTGTRAGAPFQSIFSYSPAMVGDPAFRACENTMWAVPSVSVSTGGAPSQTTPGTGKIVGVHERIKIPAGEFDTVHYTRTLAQGTGNTIFQEYWRSIADGLNVRYTYRSSTVVATGVVVARATAPVILTQPLNANAMAGGTASFSVSAAGYVPLAYQWRKNGVPIPGATAASYATPPTTAADNGALFSVSITNSAGTATSVNATLAIATAQNAPTITAHPVSFLSLAPGGSSALWVVPTGFAPQYQWRKNGVDIPGATTGTSSSTTYDIPPVTAADDGSTYSVMVCNTLGCATSLNTTLQVVSPSTVGVAQVSAGGHHSLALRQDGTVWGWGKSSLGVLGINRPYPRASGGASSYLDQSAPVEAVSASNLPFLGAVEVHAGNNHSLVRRVDGTLWSTATFADQGTGVGVSTQTDTSFAPVLFAANAPLTDVVAATTGETSSYAVTSDGKAWAWGGNRYYELGDGTNLNRLIPTEVKDAGGAAFTGVSDVSAGNIHTLWLKTDGTVWENGTFSLADGSGTFARTPVRIETAPGVALDRVVAIAAGSAHNVALRSDGTAWAWGSNQNGALGTGSSTGQLALRPIPVRDAAGATITGIAAVSAGDQTTFLLLSNGTVMAAGSNASGRLGDGTSTTRFNPVPVRNVDGTPFGNVRALATHYRHTVAIKHDGTVWAWGEGEARKLGDGGSTNRLNPVRVQGLAP